MEVEYNYRPYIIPKRAVYYASGNDYVKDPVTGLLGWSRIEREALVIGEDDTSFVTELKEHKNRDSWSVDYGKVCLLPLGFHKSRLKKWLPALGQQRRIFD
jgi:hypothetical protein